MKEYLHATHLNRCIGCTRCMRHCPTEAIRIKNNQVYLLDQCIYCGNCIETCQKSAFKISSDSLSELQNHSYNIAILPISIYGMVTNQLQLKAVYRDLYQMGFDEVIDLSGITEQIASKVDSMLEVNTDKTYISTQCPAIVRFIQVKYPTLMNHLLPFNFPFEIAATTIRKKMQAENKLNVGISYLSECLANFMAIKKPFGNAPSNVDHVFLFNELFKDIVPVETDEVVSFSEKGVMFASAGAFEQSLMCQDILSVNGIEQVNAIFEKLYLGTLSNVKLIEAYSCNGGCIGGNFTLDHPSVLKLKLKKFVKNAQGYRNETKWSHQGEMYFKEEFIALSPFKLDKDMVSAVKKMNQINELLKQLPKIDCCACGSPSCRALAEDIILNMKTIEDCVVLRKERSFSV